MPGAVTWITDNQPVAGVDRTEKPMMAAVYAWANGTARITATTTGGSEGSISGSAVVAVRQKVATVVVSPPAGVLVKGDTLRLSAEALDANRHAVPGAAPFVWTSSDPSVASVDASGLVKAVAGGEVAVSAGSSGATGTADLVVMDSRYPFHIHVSESDSALMEDSHWRELAETVERWGTVLATSIARPYVFQANARCLWGPTFEAGDTLAPGIHLWFNVRDEGHAKPAHTRCNWASREDALAVPDSLRAIPGGGLSVHTGIGGAFMHGVGHILHSYYTEAYDGISNKKYPIKGTYKTLYFAVGDRPREAVEHFYRETTGGEELDWDALFPSGIRGIPMMSYYDGIVMPMEGHVNSCVAGSYDPPAWRNGGETLRSRVANDVMMAFPGNDEYPAYITRLTLSMIDFPGYVYTPHMAEVEIRLGLFSEEYCYGSGRT